MMDLKACGRCHAVTQGLTSTGLGISAIGIRDSEACQSFLASSEAQLLKEPPSVRDLDEARSQGSHRVG